MSEPRKKLSPAAEVERTLHRAEVVVEGARKRHGAAMQIASALRELREGLAHPTGSWTDGERAARARLLQALETAAELLEEP